MTNILIDTDSHFSDFETPRETVDYPLPCDSRILGGMALGRTFDDNSLALLDERVRRVFGTIKHDKGRELDLCIAYGYGDTTREEEIIDQRLGQSVKALKINVFPSIEKTDRASVLFVGQTSLKSFKVIKYSGPVATTNGQTLDAVVYSVLSSTANF